MLVRLGGFLLLVLLAIWLYALLDASTADRSQVRHLRKGGWVALVALTFIIGAVLWMLYGRPLEPRQKGRRTIRQDLPRGRATQAWTHRSSSPPPPDDDPDFLARLDKATRHDRRPGQRDPDRRRREAELRQREAELRRREAELQQREADSGKGAQSDRPHDGSDKDGPDDTPNPEQPAG